MKKFKNLNASIADLKALCAGSDEAAIEQLRRLRRKPHAKTVEVYRCVREVARLLIMAFMK